MAKNLENIDRYFGGKMSTEEMRQFEGVMTQDPVLQQEFSFQQELVEGIQTVRKAELKAALSNVDVTGTAGLESATLTKIIGGVLVVGVVAVGAYLYFGEEQEVAPATAVTTLTQITDQHITNSEELSEVTEVETATPIAEESAELVLKNNSTPQAERNNQSGEVEISEANVTEGFEDEEEVSETEAPTNHLIMKSKVIHSTLEVSIEKSNRYSFHYQVKNNALALYGDFSKLYEIIEFHKDGNVSTYLKYDEKYYEIDKLQSKPVPLVELTGDGLLSLLDSIENNKER